jgi:3-phenylpropionate/cinnamic acid dioxygenase small subunit
MATELETLLERERIIDLLTRMFLATDARDWAALRGCFSEQVRFDMSSVGGPPEQLTSASDIAAGWEAGLAPIDQLHHQVGNFQVRIDGVSATAFCYGIAFHFKARRSGGNTRTFVGSYDFELQMQGEGTAHDWRITAMRFRLKFIDGNATLEAPET